MNIERLEMDSDALAEIHEAERTEAFRDQPEPEPLSDEELDSWEEDYNFFRQNIPLAEAPIRKL